MNTILITGTAQPIIGGKVDYNVNIWASKEGEQIQFVKYSSLQIAGYSTLWAYAKSIVISYFGNETKFDDGAYTQFLDHLTIIK